MSSLQVPELRLPAGDGGGTTGPNNRGTAPLLLVPQSSVPRRRHSWICGKFSTIHTSLADVVGIFGISSDEYMKLYKISDEKNSDAFESARSSESSIEPRIARLLWRSGR
ncbi:hypothetical protein K0M31_008365 [Melipona bicolor]|uniref:Uncharacterized protein n=1 Tax=Melipona bicolor TaxID=60889 RepID=A0AA40KKG5_9HYME|nr:hypothetical protein K0M31_008365 [Melipona bicolor]